MLFETSTFLASVINFIILLIVITRLLYKPVRNFLDERTNTIESQIESAKEQEATATELKERLEAELQQSKQQAKEYLNQAVKRSEEMHDEIIETAKQEASLIQKRTREELAREQEKTRQTLKNELAELAVNVASKVIQESLDQQKQEQLIADALTKLDQESLGEWQ